MKAFRSPSGMIVALASATALLAAASNVWADPPPGPICDDAGIRCLPRTFCFRTTAIQNDPADAEGNRISLELEVLNWSDTEAFGLTVALNTGTESVMQICDNQPPVIAGASVDAAGRPLGSGSDDANFPPADGTAGAKSGGTNDWSVVSQTSTMVMFSRTPSTPGTGLAQRDLLGTATTADACALVPGCLVVSGSPIIANVETIDNGSPSVDGQPDNVLDGFVISIDNSDPGEMVSFNWFLTDDTGQPIGVSGAGNAYGFGAFNLWASADSTCPNTADNGPAIWERPPTAPEGPGTNEGTSAGLADMFVSVSDINSRFESELAGGLTAPFLNPADNIYSAPINAQRIGETAGPPSVAAVITVQQNSPNPFNPRTAVRLTMTQAGTVRAWVVNARGEFVASILDRQLPAGPSIFYWNGADAGGMQVASGTYLLHVRAFDQTIVKKMTLIR